NETGVAIANVFPAPNLDAPTQIGRQNWGVASQNSAPAKQFSVRIDHAISSRQRFFGRFGIMRDSTDNTGLPPGADLTEEFWRHFYSVSLNDDYLFSPTFFATFRYGFSRYSSDTVASAQRQDPMALKMPEVILRNSLFSSWPRITMGEALYGIGGRVKYRANDTHSLAPTLSILAGSHGLRLGADVRLVNWNSVELGSDGAGSFGFNNVFTRSDPFLATSGNTTGTSMASLLLGVPASGNFGGPTPYSLRHYYFAGFLQDDWKVSSRLTLNVGLRYDLETPYWERYDRLTYGFDPAGRVPVQVPGMELRGGLLFVGVGERPRWQGRMDRNNLAPRFGLAYQLRSSTVIRAGYGLFYSSNTGNLDTTTGVPPTYSLAAPYVATTDGGATPYTTISNPYPQGLPPVLGNALGLASRLGSSVDFVNQYRVLPYAQQWQFSIQQSLPSRIRLEAAFVRMLSVKGLESFNLSEKPDRYLALGAEENRRVPNPFFGIFPADTSLGTSSTFVQRQFWLPYPQFTSVSMRAANTRTTNYHAVELSLEKRLSNGLTLLANYTASKMMENNLTSLVNTRHYRSISDLDVPYVANIAYVYDLPFGKGQPLLSGARGVFGKIVGGWVTSGRLYISGGPPLGISDTNGRPIRLRNASKSGPIGERLGDRVDPVTKQVLNP
ncbi:MAG: TonB-dependent receptor, partial [Acidobacteriota bacterium]